MAATLRTFAWLTATALALAIGLYALRYVEGDPRLFPAGLRSNFQAHPIAFLAHTTAGGVALLCAPWQVWAGLRRRRPRLHRWMGRVYVTACLIGGVAGLRIAFGTAYGPVAAAGFAALAVIWLTTTTMGFQAARAGEFDRHRAWMLRSIALTFAAVTLRLELAAAVMLRLDFDTAYQAIAWACWLPNLVVAEWWIRRRGRRRRARRAAAPATTPSSAG